MSKVDELRKKYARLTPKTFEKLVEGDTTPTKKYLEYLCKSWENVMIYGHSITLKKLIDAVKDFDNLLPYIDNKDIYSSNYQSINNLLDCVIDARQKKDDNSFVRADHIDVIVENDEYLLLCPKTFEGSLKYGANTRWCTASKNNKSHFTTHSKHGVLLYLVAKNISVKENYKKIAFKLNSRTLCGDIQMWNQLDTPILEDTIINSGWGIERFTEIIFTSRLYAKEKEIIDDVREKVRKVTNFMSTIDLVDFQKNITILNKINDVDISKTMEVISEFTKKIESFIK